MILERYCSLFFSGIWLVLVSCSSHSVQTPDKPTAAPAQTYTQKASEFRVRYHSISDPFLRQVLLADFRKLNQRFGLIGLNSLIDSAEFPYSGKECEELIRKQRVYLFQEAANEFPQLALLPDCQTPEIIVNDAIIRLSKDGFEDAALHLYLDTSLAKSFRRDLTAALAIHFFRKYQADAKHPDDSLRNISAIGSLVRYLREMENYPEQKTLQLQMIQVLLMQNGKIEMSAPIVSALKARPLSVVEKYWQLYYEIINKYIRKDYQGAQQQWIQIRPALDSLYYLASKQNQMFGVNRIFSANFAHDTLDVERELFRKFFMEPALPFFDTLPSEQIAYRNAETKRIQKMALAAPSLRALQEEFAFLFTSSCCTNPASATVLEDLQ